MKDSKCYTCDSWINYKAKHKRPNKCGFCSKTHSSTPLKECVLYNNGVAPSHSELLDMCLKAMKEMREEREKAMKKVEKQREEDKTCQWKKGCKNYAGRFDYGCWICEDCFEEKICEEDE